MLFVLEKIQPFTSVIRDIIIDIFIVMVISYLIYYWVKNYCLKNKFKTKNKNFKIQRCLEDGGEKDRNKIYLVNKIRNTYQWIVDNKTLNELFIKQGFERPPREDKACFSKRCYIEEEKIELNESVDNIIDIINLLKVLKDNI